MTDLHQTRDRLIHLIARLEPPLSNDEAVQLEGFVDAAEFGIALEWLVGYLSDSSKPVGNDALAELDALATSLGIVDQIADERAQIISS